MEELLDIYDETNTRHLGTKTRREAHRDGDWHRCFHLWIVHDDGVLLQRRAPAKATFPDMLDATAAGHISAGETPEEGIREVEEELGVTYGIDQLTDLGVHSITDHPRPDIVNREHQYVYAVRDDRPLSDYTLDPVEVAGLVHVSHDDFARLIAGHDAGGIPAKDLIPAVYLTAIAERLRMM